MRQIKSLAVDDHPLLRQGIAGVIQGKKQMLIVGEARSATGTGFLLATLTRHLGSR